MILRSGNDFVHVDCIFFLLKFVLIFVQVHKRKHLAWFVTFKVLHSYFFILKTLFDRLLAISQNVKFGN